jgi:hypothetical protein
MWCYLTLTDNIGWAMNSNNCLFSAPPAGIWREHCVLLTQFIRVCRAGPWICSYKQPKQHWPTGLCNEDAQCFLWGTDSVLKCTLLGAFQTVSCIGVRVFASNNNIPHFSMTPRIILSLSMSRCHRARWSIRWRFWHVFERFPVLIPPGTRLFSLEADISIKKAKLSRYRP